MAQYTPGRVIGRGTSGDALLVQRKSDGLNCVIKRMPLVGIGSKEAEAFENEVQLLSQLNHPCVVDSLDSFVDDDDTSNAYLCIVMRYCDGGDLESFLQMASQQGATIAEKQVLFHFVQLALALEYIHHMRVLHRDLKSMNIFIHKGMMKLGDFGTAKLLDQDMLFAQTCVGTPYYMSPEVFMGKPYNHKSDIWSLGCLLYELTMLKQPFHTDSLSDLAGKIMQGSYLPVSTDFSAGLRTLIKNMLALSPDERPSGGDILLFEALQAPLRSFVKALQSEKDHTSNKALLNFKDQLQRLGLTELAEEINVEEPSIDVQPIDRDLVQKADEQEQLLQKEQDKAKALELLMSNLRFGYDQRSERFDDHRAVLARERERKQEGNQTISYNLAEKRREALLSDDVEKTMNDRIKDLVAEKRQQRVDAFKVFEEMQDRHSMLRQRRLKKESELQASEQKLLEKIERTGNGADEAYTMNLERQELLTMISRDREELKHMQEERKWLWRHLEQMESRLNSSTIPELPRSKHKVSPINARRTTRLPSAFGGPRLAYREARKTMFMPSTGFDRGESEKTNEKAKTTTNLPHSQPRRRSGEGVGRHRRKGSKEKLKGGEDAKARVLAAKDKKRKEQERKQMAALSAARRDYDKERLKADQRTKNFMQKSGRIPDPLATSGIELPDLDNTTPNMSPTGVDVTAGWSPTRTDEPVEDGLENFEELSLLEEEFYQDERELTLLRTALDRHQANLQKLRRSLHMNQRKLQMRSAREAEKRKEQSRTLTLTKSSMEVLPVIKKKKKNRRRGKSTEAKISNLTKKCTRLLGEEVFLKAKAFLKQANNNETEQKGDELLQSLITIMGKEKLIHWQLLDNLIYLESTLKSKGNKNGEKEQPENLKKAAKAAKAEKAEKSPYDKPKG